MVIPGFQEVQKEVIGSLHFPAGDVLSEKEQIQARQLDLDRALALGNLEHAKIRIYFEDSESRKMVETTVWGVTDTRIILKQGMVIPIGRIHSVELQ